MKVNPTQAFDVIYSISWDDSLGAVFSVFAVQLSASGQLTLLNQRIYEHTCKPYESVLDDIDKELIRLADSITHDQIFKKFKSMVPMPKKNIKSVEFFKKYMNDDLLNFYIKPFVEKTMVKFIELAGANHKEIYKMGKGGNPAWKKISPASGLATVLFHFRRNEHGTRYFATIKYGDSRIDFMNPETMILANKPAYILANEHIYRFDKSIEAKRFSPFLKQKWIEVKPQAEEKYFTTFVRPLLERFDVYAEGFTINTEKHRGDAVLKLQNWNDSYHLALNFLYNNQQFGYNQEKKVHVSMAKKGNEYTFTRIRRSSDWESGRAEILISRGATYFEGCLFKINKGNLYETIDWLSENQNYLMETGFCILQDTERKFYTGNQEVSIGFSSSQDWFDITGKVSFGSFEISFVSLKKYILNGNREFILPDGSIAIIPEAWFSRFQAVFNEAVEFENGIRLKKNQIGLLSALWKFEEHTRNIWQKKLHDILEPRDCPVPETFQHILRPYQTEGFKWMKYLEQNNFGGILADDMGLGKTVQTLCLLVSLKNDLYVNENNDTGNSDYYQPDLFITAPLGHTPVVKNSEASTSLLIVPTSLSLNWLFESKKFSPELRIYLHAGIMRDKTIQNFKNFDVIITTYGILRIDSDLLKEFEFNYIILDESQAVKNPESITALSLFKLRGKKKLALTGTPVENTLGDLWTQMNFVNPGLLGSYSHYQSKYIQAIEKANDIKMADNLRRLLSPFILRRTKENVAPELPEKMEFIRLCEMEKEQAEVYEKVKSQFRNELLESMANQTYSKKQISFFQGLTQLRLIANHPVLTDENYTGNSAKFHDVIHLTKTGLEQNHKIIIFSQFVRHLKIFKDYFQEQKISFSYLDGSTSANDRMKEVERFQTNSTIRIFLISLKAGGTGLNLTAADYVFMLDPWWNPAIERQAQDRTHRIGQDKQVFVYKFITSNTIEEKILKLQERKKIWADNLVMMSDAARKQISAEEILELLS